MKKNIYLVLAFLLTTIACSCGRSSNKEIVFDSICDKYFKTTVELEISDTEMLSKLMVTLDTTDTDVPVYCYLDNGELCAVISGSNNVYITGLSDSSVLSAIRLNDILSDDEHIFSALNNAGKFIILTDAGDEEWGRPDRCIIYDADLERVLMDEVILETSGDDFSDMCIDSDGNIFLAYGSRLLKLNQELSVVEVTDFDFYVNSLLVSGSKLYITFEGNSNEKVKIASLDTNSLDLVNEYCSDDSTLCGDTEIIGVFNTYIYFLESNQSLYRFDFGNNILEEILNFNEYRILTTADEVMLIEGKLLFVGRYRNETGVFSVDIGEEVTDVQIIDIAILGAEDNWIQNRIADFNVDYPDYHINASYYATNIPEGVYSGTDTEQFLLDVSNGNLPDIVYCSKDYAALLKQSGFLANLCDFSDLNDSKYIESVLDCMKNPDGSITLIAPFISISGFAGYDSDFFMCDSDNVIRHANREKWGDVLLTRLFTRENYSDEKLHLYLEFIDSHISQEYEEIECIAQQLKTGELGYIECDIGGFGSYLLLCEYFGTSPEIALPIVESDFYLGVFDDSDNNDGCSLFFDYILSDEALLDDAKNYLSRIPVSSSALEYIMLASERSYNNDLINPYEAYIDDVYQDNEVCYYSDLENDKVGTAIVQKIEKMENGLECEIEPVVPALLYEFSPEEVLELKGEYINLLQSVEFIYMPDYTMRGIASSYISQYEEGRLSYQNAEKEINNAIGFYLLEQQ